MKKILFFLALLVGVNSFAIEYQNNKSAIWRDGFITAYKAMSKDSEIQGLLGKPIKTNRYIIYFDTNRNDIAQWDKLMLVMFGYTSSVYDPIRAKNGWIIFASFDDKATAKQELQDLNNKIFANTKNLSLKLYDNKNHRVFYTAKTLLAKDIKDLEQILKNNYKKKLQIAKKRLQQNQKVAVIIVNNKKDKKKVNNIISKINKNTKINNKILSPVKKKPKNKPKKIHKNNLISIAPLLSVSPKGKFIIKNATAMVYKLNSNKEYIGNEKSFNVNNFIIVGVAKNNGKYYPYSSIISDSDGTKYVKVFHKNLFIALQSVGIKK